MRIIIAGNGKVGTMLARQLSAEGYDLTLIDSNNDVLSANAERMDVMTVHGNCAAMEVLRQAEVGSADLLIAATSADEVNLLCCTTAHGLNPNLHTIARIRNPEYAEQAYVLRNVFALSLTVNPELQTAMEIERLLSFPGFLRRESFARGRVAIVELYIDAHSKLRDVALHQLESIVRTKVLVCAVQRGNVTTAPGGNFVLHEGDHIFVTASTADLTQLLNSLDIVAHRAHRVMLCGGGRVSFYLAQRLRALGMQVRIIERDFARCRQLAELLPTVEVVHGDASSQALLEEEGIIHCDALVTLTGLDELNLVISLYGNSRGVPQIVTKLGRMETDELLNALPLGSVVAPKELCTNTIVRYVRAMQNQVGAAISVHSIAHGQAEAVEFRVDDSTLHCGEILKNLRLRPNVLLAGISRHNRIILPDGNTSFQKGDILVVVTTGDAVLHHLNDIFLE